MIQLQRLAAAPRLVGRTHLGAGLARRLCLKTEEPNKPESKLGLKAMISKYGYPFVVYYTGMYAVNYVAVLGVLHATEVDPTPIVAGFDSVFGTSLIERIDPTLGNYAVAFGLNELLEPGGSS